MKYEVFLSYAHKDADKYGRDYIDEIKRQIEASLGGEELVFLDADALELGDEWNSKIQECLDKCSVFVCLLSENYVKSEYCARERLWWAQKEMKKGRLNKATLPLFYIKIDDSADADAQRELERLSHLQNDVAFTPWFPDGAKFSARELVRRRLENARILSKIQSIKDDAETIGKSISSVPPYNQRFVGRVNELCRIRQVCTHGGMAIGSIPVIHGEAGCGKSEISFAYAHGYASEYPGGRFFVPMEHAKSWDEAWLRLAEKIDSRSCLPVYEVLGLKKEDRQQEPADLAKVIAQRMWIHIRNNGQTLFLLDNIDNMELLEDGMLTGLFPTGEVPEDLDMVATTRGTPVLDNCSMAVTVPIGDLGEDASLELLRLHCGNLPFNLAPPRNDRETVAAKELLKFLEYHAWSVEIVAGCLGKEHRYGATPEKVLEELRCNFQINATCRSFREIPDCIEKLLQPSIDRIKQLELGDEILELA
ncbi:MAG: toll/interleukin-1 receptor domain-containing protein, partial [Kiritimatiellae bacterium]|nr:toll/interleukin-1 receptor domain-containing protein [Kiritimatiellia bacterium]